MKNKLLAVLILGTIFLLAMASICLANDYYSYYKHIELGIDDREALVNGDTKYMPQAAYEKGGRTLVPFRFLGESLGAAIGWDADKKQAKLTLGGNQVVVTVDSQAAYVGNKPVTLDIPAEINNGSLFVPLRFMSESLGADVDYDPDLKLISVECANISDWVVYTEAETGAEFKHPRDWTANTEEDGNVLAFTSPYGSELSLTVLPCKPKDLYAELKKAAETEGWEFEWETLYVPDDLNGGYDLVFSRYDEENDSYMWEAVIVVEPDDQCSIMCDLTAEDSYFEMDRYVAYKILTSE